MAIADIVVTNGAPVTASRLSSLVGLNRIWIVAGAHESISVFVDFGGILVDNEGSLRGQREVYQCNGEGVLDYPIAVCFPTTNNEEAAVIVELSDGGGNVITRVMSFQPLREGQGNFLWYGVADGVPPGKMGFGSVFVDVKQSTDVPPNIVLAARGREDFTQILGENGWVRSSIFAVGSDGCLEIKTQSVTSEIGVLCCSLPSSPDGEMLVARFNFTQL